MTNQLPILKFLHIVLQVIIIEREASPSRLPPLLQSPPSSPNVSTLPLEPNSLPLMPTSMPSMSTIETPIVESTTMESVMDSSTMVPNRESLVPMDTSGLVMRPSTLGGLEARYAPGVSKQTVCKMIQDLHN